MILHARKNKIRFEYKGLGKLISGVKINKNQRGAFPSMNKAFRITILKSLSA